MYTSHVAGTVYTVLIREQAIGVLSSGPGVSTKWGPTVCTCVHMSVPLIVTHSYNLMLQCWKVPPNQRPQFSAIRESLMHMLCHMYPYLEMQEAAPQ